MPNDEPQYISCDDVHKLMSEIKNDLDVHYHSVAEFINRTSENVKQYKSEREELKTQLTDNQRALEDHMASESPKLYAIQTKLNLALALVISACLFGLAGPNGLREIGKMVEGSGIGADGLLALLGFGIPLLVPLGNKLFVRVVSPKDTKTVVVTKD